MENLNNEDAKIIRNLDGEIDDEDAENTNNSSPSKKEEN